EGNSATLSTPALTDWVIAFSDRIIAQRGVAAAPIIYCNRSFARDELDTRLANYDLWLAYLTNVDWSIAEPPPTTTYPKPTGVFNNWCFWQYNWTGSSGGISPLDLDVCHNEYKPLSSFLIPYPPIVLTISAVNGAGALQLAFTNATEGLFAVFATTNLNSPFSNWTMLGTATESSPGYYQFTDSQASNSPVKFYRVRAP
ncbi:MAG: GH25 family lysozyme, partial [Limisphaerales bacterium]